MSESVRQDLPIAHPDDRIELRTSEEQHLVIRKAAELVGWTVSQYVLSAALDRAERDLCQHAATQGPARRLTEQGKGAGPPKDQVVPFAAVVTALGLG